MKNFLFGWILFTFFLFAQDSKPVEQNPSLETVREFIETHAVEDLVFDGMFKGIEKLGPNTLNHLYTLVQDSEEEVHFRELVLRAIGELGDKKAIPLLKELEIDIVFEDALKEEIPYILYTLGETETLDQALKQFQEGIKAFEEKNRGSKNPEFIQERLALYYQLADLTYKMKKYELCCDAYASIQIIYPNAEVLYNYACALALAGKGDKAMEKLWEALANKELNSAEALEKDGDLRSLRTRSDFKELLQKLKSKLEENY